MKVLPLWELSLELLSGLLLGECRIGTPIADMIRVRLVGDIMGIRGVLIMIPDRHRVAVIGEGIGVTD